MARAPSICGYQSGLSPKCVKPATKGGRCEEHKPVPYDGAKQRWKALKPPNWSSICRTVRREADGLCERCGAEGSQVDHIVPVSVGGVWTRDNAQYLCEPCHRIKSAADRRKYKSAV